MTRESEALEVTLEAIRRAHGPGSIMVLGAGADRNVSVISTGCLSLDRALGCGGFPRGRIVEIFGAEASGKTTLGLSLLASAQDGAGVAAFIDAEHALDPRYARILGVDLDRLLVCQPDCGEQALEIAEQLIRSGAVDAVVVDSVAALVPRAELEGEMGDENFALQARMMSAALRKLAGSIHRSRAVFAFINQLRTRIGAFFGNPDTTPGGRALKFYASVRVEVARVGEIKRGGEVVGSRMRARVVKNKVAPPFKSVEYDLLHDRGIDRAADLLDLAAVAGVVQRAGAWYAFGETKLGNGRDQAAALLHSDAALFARVLEALSNAECGMRNAE